MTIHFINLQITRSDIRPHIKWTVSLVILHMVTSIFLKDLWGYIHILARHMFPIFFPILPYQHCCPLIHLQIVHVTHQAWIICTRALIQQILTALITQPMVTGQQITCLKVKASAMIKCAAKLSTFIFKAVFSNDRKTRIYLQTFTAKGLSLKPSL